MMSHIENSGIAAVMVGLLLAVICCSGKAEASASELKSQRPSVVATGDKQKSEEKKGNELPFGLMEGMQQILREERIEALSEIDKERQATLAYLTEERKAVMEELNRTIDILLKEKKVTMVELEIMGNRIVENAMIQSKGLIDHFFVRTLQLLGVIVLGVCIIGAAYYLVRVRNKDRGKLSNALH